jgi:hypothetical protein
MCLTLKYQSFLVQKIFQKDVVQQKKFLQDLALLVVKTHLPIQFVENTWLKCLVMIYVQELCFYQEKRFHKKYWLI